MFVKYYLILTCCFIISQSWIHNFRKYGHRSTSNRRSSIRNYLTTQSEPQLNEVIAKYQADLKELHGKPELVDFLIKLESSYPGIAKNINLYRSIYPFPLDSFQEQSLQALLNGKNVLVTTPTGSGKTVVGELAIYYALMAGLRIAYTTPLKALSNQKFHDFQQRFGHDRVGLLTGDFVIHRNATVMIMTTEIFRNMLYDVQSTGNMDDLFANAAASDETNASTLSNPIDIVEADKIHNRENVARDAKQLLSNLFLVCFDEFHYMNDAERGTVWEESIIACPLNIRIVALSATMGNVKDIQSWMSSIHGKTALIQSDFRPVPLRYYYAMKSKIVPFFAHPQAGPGSFLSQTRNTFPNNTITAVKEEVTDKDKSNANKALASKLPQMALEDPTALNPSITTHQDTIRSKILRVLQNQRKHNNGKDKKDMKHKVIKKHLTFAEKKLIEMNKRNDIIEEKTQVSKELTPTHTEIVRYLAKHGKLPVIFFIFSRKACESLALEIMDTFSSTSSPMSLLTPTEVMEVNAAIVKFMQANPMIPIQKSHIQLLQAGISIHHAGLLNLWKEFIEHLFNENKIKILFATETLAAGVNMPARTTVVTAVTKQMQSKIVSLKTSQLLQMAGRAGRRGKDIEGNVIVTHNVYDELKLARSLLLSKVDAINSHFRLSYKMILQLLHQKSLLDCRLLLERCFSTYMKQMRVQERLHLSSIFPAPIVTSQENGNNNLSINALNAVAMEEEEVELSEKKTDLQHQEVEKNLLNNEAKHDVLVQDEQQLYYQIFLQYPMATVKEYLKLITQFQKASEYYKHLKQQTIQDQQDMLESMETGQLVQLQNGEMGYYLERNIHFHPTTGEIIQANNISSAADATSGYLLLSPKGKYLIVEMQDIHSVIVCEEMKMMQNAIQLTGCEGESLAQYFHDHITQFKPTRVLFVPLATANDSATTNANSSSTSIIPMMSNHTLISHLLSPFGPTPYISIPLESSGSDSKRPPTKNKKKSKAVENRKIWTYSIRETKSALLHSWKDDDNALSITCEELLLRSKQRKRISSDHDSDEHPVVIAFDGNIPITMNEELHNQSQNLLHLEQRIVQHEITQRHTGDELYHALHFLLSSSSDAWEDAWNAIEEPEGHVANDDQHQQASVQQHKVEDDVAGREEEEEKEENNVPDVAMKPTHLQLQDDIYVWKQFQSMINFLIIQKALIIKEDVKSSNRQIKKKHLSQTISRIVNQHLSDDSQPFQVTRLGKLAIQLLGGENELWLAMILTHPEFVQAFESGEFQASHLAAVISSLFIDEFRASRARITIKPSKEIMKLMKILTPLQNSLNNTQSLFQLEFPVLLSHQITGLTEAWCGNMSWYDLAVSTSLDQGDLSRIFLRTMTSLSQIGSCSKSLLSPIIITLAKEAIGLINRFPINYFGSDQILSSITTTLKQPPLPVADVVVSSAVEETPTEEIRPLSQEPIISEQEENDDDANDDDDADNDDVSLDTLFQLIDQVEQGTANVNLIQTTLSSITTSTTAMKPSVSALLKKSNRKKKQPRHKDWKQQFVTMETIHELLPSGFIEESSSSS